MNKDQINLQEAYSRIYHKIDEDFEDQVRPSPLERAESVYGQENPDVATFDTHNIEKIYNAVKGGMSLQDFEHWVKSVQMSEVDDLPQNESTEEIPPVEGEDEEWGEGPDDSLPPKTNTSDEDENINEDAVPGLFTLWYKDPELEKTRKWYSANSLEALVNKVNKGNTGEYYSLPVVDEDRVFKNKEELLDFCSHSDFFIKGPDGNLVSGYTVKPGDWENDELQEKKEKFSVSIPTQGQLVSKMRAPVHKPTKEIKPKKGVYNRQQFKKYD